MSIVDEECWETRLKYWMGGVGFWVSYLAPAFKFRNVTLVYPTLVLSFAFPGTRTKRANGQTSIGSVVERKPP